MTAYYIIMGVVGVLTLYILVKVLYQRSDQAE